MTVKVLNPDSTVLQQVDGQWQKLAILILWKCAGRNVVRITAAEIAALKAEFAPSGPVIFTHGMHDAFEFSLISEDDAKRLVAHDATMRGHA